MSDMFKVGKNLVSKDGGTWVVEIWEYDDFKAPKGEKTPMYSVFDSYKLKENAVLVAKRVNKANAHRSERFYAHRLEGGL
jgi:hypothetical protein